MDGYVVSVVRVEFILVYYVIEVWDVEDMRFWVVGLWVWCVIIDFDNISIEIEKNVWDFVIFI